MKLTRYLAILAMFFAITAVAEQAAPAPKPQAEAPQAQSLENTVKAFLKQYPEFGEAKSFEAQPDWASGKRIRVRTATSSYLAYLNQAGDAVITLYRDTTTGRERVFDATDDAKTPKAAPKAPAKADAAAKPAPAPSKAEPAGDTVYITKTGQKYHRAGCRYLARSQIPIAKADAVAKGYGACSVCKP